MPSNPTDPTEGLAASLVSLDAAIQQIIDLLTEALVIDRVSIITFNTEQREVTGFYTAGIGKSAMQFVPYSELWDGLSGWVLRERLPALSPNGCIDARESPAVQRRRFDTLCGAIIVVPILLGDAILGTLTAINRPDQRDFTPNDVNVLMILANQVATAIEKDRLYRAMAAEVHERQCAQAELQRAYEEVEQKVAERTAALTIANQALEKEIAERTSAEERLRQSEERYRLISEVASDYTFSSLVGSDGRLSVNWVSGSFERIMGYTLEEFVAHGGWAAVVHPEDRAIDARDMNELRANRSIVSELRIVTRTGAVVWVRVYARPLWDATQNRLVGIYGAVQDITAHKQAEEALHESQIRLEERVEARTAEIKQAEALLRRTNLELEHAIRAKDNFLANMSHELRTPLNAILTLSESLLEQQRGPLNAYQQKSLRLLESSAQHLLDLINDILDLSKIEAGKLDLQLELVDTDAICRTSLLFVQELADKKQMTLIYTNNAPLAHIRADPRRLKQMLINLLGNAVKFTPAGGIVELSVGTDDTAGLIRLAVQDTGIGITAEQMPKLFQPFSQLDAGLTRQHEGSGLGLALVQRLARQHGGRVDVESTGVPGNGSRFTITLPYRPDDVAASAEPPQHQHQHEMPPLQRRTQPLILLAEDSEVNIAAVGEYLEDKGYRVLVARNGREALHYAHEAQPDLVLMDIQMPELDGMEAIRRLRADPQSHALPIIALTALAMPGDRERCLQAGADEYMSKPVRLRELAALIARLLHQRESR